MTEVAPRYACPVCLGVVMDKIAVGEQGRLIIDLCRRCHGSWLAHGTVQRLRRQPAPAFRAPDLGPIAPHVAHCHQCHAPLARHAANCGACGGGNALDCPQCDRPMRLIVHDGLQLDICEQCKGAWFDRDELEALWSPRFDLALARRNLTRRDAAEATRDPGDDLVLHSLFWAPDILMHGGMLAGDAAAASVSVASSAPELIGAMPEAAAGAFDAVGEASASVFEAVIEIVAGIFS